MGGVVSDLLAEAGDLVGPPAAPRAASPGQQRWRRQGPGKPQNPTQRQLNRSSRPRNKCSSAGLKKTNLDASSAVDALHGEDEEVNNRPRMCHHHQQKKPRRRPSFAERLERIHELEDPRMVQRSSTPTAAFVDQCPAVCEEEEEYCAWTNYLQTPGTFIGQLKPNLPGAFSGMCFPQTDPRWICHHPNAAVAASASVVVKSIVS